ncbi:ATP-binding cassette domain-containing protein [Candidatus Pelagibacter sp. HIMB1623]|uniref:ATP-binding cassette domain-containing protein n=1 Tax=Candidatus Pelagibacter sp. HIMB1623 TaxID=3413358 RepID=UPI003F83EE56
MLSSLNQFLNIFAENKKKYYFFFIFANLIITFLEMLGIGIIFPLLKIIIDPTFVLSIKEYDIKVINNLNESEFLIVILILMIAIFIIKNFLIGILSWAQIKYSLYLQNKVATTLLNKYINSSYLFHKQNDSSKLIRAINYDSMIVITGFVIPSFYFITEAFLFIGIIGLLAFYQIYGLLIAFFFSVISILIYKKFSLKLKDHGKKKQLNETLKLKYATTIFEGIKEILFYRKQNFFYNLYQEANLKSNNSLLFLEGVKLLPRLLLETFGVIILGSIMALLILSEVNLSKLLPVFAIYVVGGFKILPSLNRIISAVQQMRFNKIYLETLVNDYKNQRNFQHVSNDAKIQNINFNDKIELKNIYFDYKVKGREKNILTNTNISFKKNTITAIVGKSGSGKSTIVDILLGLLKPDSGEIIVDGKSINPNIFKLKIGYVPQNNFLLNDSIKKNIAIGIPENEIDKTRVNRALELSNLINDFKISKLSIETLVGEKGLQISGGQAQRIVIARSLYEDPEIIIFDEATSSLDQSTESEILQNLLKLKETKTIILITHNERILKFCDKVISIERK